MEDFTVSALPTIFQETACPYIRGREAAGSFTTVRAHTDWPRVSQFAEDAATIEHLLSAGHTPAFEGSYKPSCAGCRKCYSMRVPVGAFEPSAKQRRILRNEGRFVVDISEGIPNDGIFHDLFMRHQTGRFGNNDPAYATQTLDAMHYYPGLTPYNISVYERLDDGAKGPLIGARIFHLGPRSAYATAYFYDPHSGRQSNNLGHFLVLKTFMHLKTLPNVSHIYMGHWIPDAGTSLSYKSQYAVPYAELYVDGEWQAFSKRALQAMQVTHVNRTGIRPIATRCQRMA